MSFPRWVLALSALAFAGIGIAFLAAPAEMGRIVGIRLAGALADGDARAVYGGLQLGCAVFLLLCARRERWWRAGLAAQLCLFGGLVGGRVIGIVAAGSPGALGLGLLAAEVVALACGAAALRGLSPPAAAGRQV